MSSSSDINWVIFCDFAMIILLLREIQSKVVKVDAHGTIFVLNNRFFACDELRIDMGDENEKNI